MTTPEKPGIRKPIHVLSLDGGGVRGLSSLLVLRDLMTRLGVKRNITPPTDLRPSDCFDLIVGTGTGGITALFLGRMRMTVDEAIVEYQSMTTTVFKSYTELTDVSLPNQRLQPELDVSALEQNIGDITARFLGHRDAALEDPLGQNTPCRTAVLASTSAHADAPPHIFCSYTKALPASRFAVHEVARATVATGGSFSTVTLGNPPVEFINAGLVGYGNPADVALDEATQIWPSSQYRIASLVSLGTGLQKIIKIGDKSENIIEVSERLVQDCQRIHFSLSSRLQFEEVAYFRFNPTRGLDVHAMEWNTEEQLTGITEGYLREPDVMQSLDKGAKILDGEIPTLTKTTTSNQGSIGKYLPLYHPAPQIFYGRDKYVQNVVNLLVEKNGVYLAILGPGGIGKTSIARTILHNDKIKSKFEKDCYFVSCEGINSSSMLVDILCEVFGLQHHSADRQSDLLMSLIHKYATRPLLLVLDNFETVWEPEPSAAESVLEALGQVKGMALVLTMRGSERPASLHWTLLPLVTTLHAAASHKTFMDICGNEDSSLTRLLDEIDHLPLAVTLMAHLGQTEKPSRLLKRWEKEKTRLLSQSQNQSRLKNIDISIGVSLNSPRMHACPEALILLSIIALLPAGIPEADLHDICPNIPDLDLAATTLCQVGLAAYDKTQTLYVLSPIRSYILEKYPLKKTLLNDLQSFHFQLAKLAALHFSEKNNYVQRRKIQHAEANIEAVLSAALLVPSDDDEDKIQAALDWTSFLRKTTPREHIMQLALRLAQQKTEGKKSQAVCLQSLGDIYFTLSDYQKAQDMLSAAQSKFEILGERFRAAQCLQSLGNIQQMLADYPKAQEMFFMAQAEFKALDHRLGMAQCLGLLGNTYVFSDIPKAQDLLSTAHVELGALGDRLGAARFWRSLGNIQYLLSDYLKAQDMLSTAQSEFEAQGDRLGAAWCIQSLGSIQEKLSDYPKAQDMLSTAQSEFEALGNRFGEAQCIQALGQIQYKLSNYSKAQDMFSTARSKFEAQRHGLGAAECLLSLGNTHCMLSDYSKAHEMISAAQSEFEALGDKFGAVYYLQYIQYGLGNYAEAQDYFATAHLEFEALNAKGLATYCISKCVQKLEAIKIKINNTSASR